MEHSDNFPSIDIEGLKYHRFTDGDPAPLRELVVRYGIPQEEVNKLIGKTEKETRENIDRFKEKHPLPVDDEPLDPCKAKYGIPYGYTRNLNDVIVEDEYEQRVIKVIVELRESGKTYPQIRKRLMKNGYKTRYNKEKWSWRMMSDIVKRHGDRVKDKLAE